MQLHVDQVMYRIYIHHAQKFRMVVSRVSAELNIFTVMLSFEEQEYQEWRSQQRVLLK